MLSGVDSDWLKKRIRQLDLNQEKLGAALHCERSVVSKIINGKQPLKLTQVIPLANILEVSPFEILQRTNFWKDYDGFEAQWASLPADISPEDRDRIIDAVRAFIRQKPDGTHTND